MLAIVIPYYKIAFFEETLKSLANQTNKQFIVYIGDDASKDDPTFLLKKYESQFLLEYHRFNNNLGGVSLVRQWERCIALSKEEEWLMILGDDDYLGNNVVELFYKYFQEFNSKANVIRFASRIVKQELNTISKVYNHPIWEKATDAYFKKFIEKSRSSLSEFVFNRVSYKKYGFRNYPLAWHSDDLAWLEFSDFKNIYSINEAVVSILSSPISISGKKDNLTQKNNARLLFLNDLVFKKQNQFSKLQKKYFLFELGILLKEQNLIKLKNTFFIWLQFVKIGALYDSLRFLRRMCIAKVERGNS